MLTIARTGHHSVTARQVCSEDSASAEGAAAAPSYDFSSEMQVLPLGQLLPMQQRTLRKSRRVRRSCLADVSGLRRSSQRSQGGIRTDSSSSRETG